MMSIVEIIEAGNDFDRLRHPPDGSTGDEMADAYLVAVLELFVSVDTTWKARLDRTKRALRRLDSDKDLLGRDADNAAADRLRAWRGHILDLMGTDVHRRVASCVVALVTIPAVSIIGGATCFL